MLSYLLTPLLIQIPSVATLFDYVLIKGCAQAGSSDSVEAVLCGDTLGGSNLEGSLAGLLDRLPLWFGTSQKYRKLLMTHAMISTDPGSIVRYKNLLPPLLPCSPGLSPSNRNDGRQSMRSAVLIYTLVDFSAMLVNDLTTPPPLSI